MSYFNITFSRVRGQNGQSGFLLIELVLTIFLVSVLGFYLCGWYSQLININRESMIRSRAVLLACSLCDKARVNKSINLDGSDKIENFEIGYALKKNNNNFNFFEVKVGWDSYSGKRTFVKIVSGYAT